MIPAFDKADRTGKLLQPLVGQPTLGKGRDDSANRAACRWGLSAFNELSD